MALPLLPERHPVRDFFVLDVLDVTPRSDMASMAHPIFSLSTKPDKRILRYLHDDVVIEIHPSTKGLATIFDNLLDEAGSEIYMRPAEDYVALGVPVNFYTVTEAARRRGEAAIGHCRRREGAEDARRMGGVVVNPPKSEALVYQPGDRIIVLAED